MFDGDMGLQGPPQLQDPLFPSSSMGAPRDKDVADGLDLSFLPDELSTQEDQSQSNTGHGWMDGEIDRWIYR